MQLIEVLGRRPRVLNDTATRYRAAVTLHLSQMFGSIAHNHRELRTRYVDPTNEDRHRHKLRAHRERPSNHAPQTLPAPHSCTQPHSKAKLHGATYTAPRA